LLDTYILEIYWNPVRVVDLGYLKLGFDDWKGIGEDLQDMMFRAGVMCLTYGLINIHIYIYYILFLLYIRILIFYIILFFRSILPLLFFLFKS
jgi:hypothetical protein